MICVIVIFFNQFNSQNYEKLSWQTARLRSKD